MILLPTLNIFIVSGKDKINHFDIYNIFDTELLTK